MAARKEFSNFAEIFGGVPSNNHWHTLVVVVCKMELACDISKRAPS
jgi:hypothetical protein